MTNLEWLLLGDEVVVRLTRMYLLDENANYSYGGLIGRYLSLYDEKTKKWGNGFYGPKWVSTNYTLLDLKYMEIDPSNSIYQESLTNYLNHLFKKYIDKSGITSMDLCLSGMFIKLLSYGKIHDKRLEEMIDYVLEYTMPDGAWNCLWNHQSKPRISSVHTTINVLEGLQEYVDNGYKYRIVEVKKAIDSAIKTLLERELIFKKGTNTPIHPSFVIHHFPSRWKYDYLRILEFLARKRQVFVPEMQPALDLLMENLKHGRLSKGTTISGRIHFPIEDERYGRFNTLRAYIVLKQYAPVKFNEIINQTLRDIKI
jgi:hypothetical protein